MDGGLDIELGQTVSLSSLKVRQASRPTLASVVGRGHSEEGMDIFIDSELLQELTDFASENTSCERGGVLIGDVFEDELGIYVRIDAMIEAKNANASQASLTFTHETWDYINHVKDEHYSTSRIVGWFHTHPGFGVFLSQHDLFIHRSFFNQEWHVALVLDPLRDQAGFFTWHDGEIEKAPGFFVFGEDRDYGHLMEDTGSLATVLGKQRRKKASSKPSEVVESVRTGRVIDTLYVLLLVLLIITVSTGVIVVVGLFQSKGNLHKARVEIENLSGELADVQSDLELLTQSYIHLSHSSDEESSTTLGLPERGNSGSEFMVQWSVQQGDTLWGITSRIGPSQADERARFVDELLEANGIKDPHHMRVGEELLIPIR